MSTPMVSAEQMLTIAGQVFAALVDGMDSTLTRWVGDPPTFDDEVNAWVDLSGGWCGRALLVTERATAADLTRALLALGADDPVSDDDLVDAFGEVANVVGGNVKALLPAPATLSLPQVRRTPPARGVRVPIQTLELDWRGRPVVVTLWRLDGHAESGMDADTSGKRR